MTPKAAPLRGTASSNRDAIQYRQAFHVGTGPKRTSRRVAMNIMRRSLLLLAIALLLTPATLVNAQERSITVASTTSTEQSGLFGHILPAFTKKTSIEVKVVAVGTGQALDIGRRGDADVVFVHDRAAEDKFVAEGWGIGRKDVMYNDFVLIGPKADPA